MFPQTSWLNDTGSCATPAGLPAFVDAPFVVVPVGTTPNIVNVGIIGVTTTETPIITIASATAGLCLRTRPNPFCIITMR